MLMQTITYLCPYLEIQKRTDFWYVWGHMSELWTESEGAKCEAWAYAWQNICGIRKLNKGQQEQLLSWIQVSS